MISVFDHEWLAALFGDEEANAHWSAEAQLAHYRAFETALASALSALGLVSAEQAQAAMDTVESTVINTCDMSRATATDGLPIPEFVRQLRHAEETGGAGIHKGATSQDVLDTALSLTLRNITDGLLRGLNAFDEGLSALAGTFGANTIMGRTRMQAALPISVRDRIDSWRRPLPDHIHALEALRPQVERLQLGGPVGNNRSFEGHADKIAAHMADELGLHSAHVWHTDRSRIVDYASRLSLITGSLGKFGQDIALMAQQGPDEISLRSGGSSSAMPHKSNPVSAELLVTLARFNAALVSGMHQALIHEQERSGAAWMLEWMIMPQMSVAATRSLSVARDLCLQIDSLGKEP